MWSRSAFFKRRAPQIPEKQAMRCGGALVPSAQPSPSASTVRYNITGKPPDKPSILIVPSMSYVAVRGKGPSMTTSTGSSGAAGSLGPTITMTSRSRTATSATSTRPSSRATLFISLLLNKLNQLQVFNGVVEAAEGMDVKGGSWVHRPGPSLFSIYGTAIAWRRLESNVFRPRRP